MHTAQAESGLAVDDARLLDAAVEDEIWAWPIIVERYSGLVVSVTSLFRLQTEDEAEVRQEVWTRLFANRKLIRQPERLAGWIKTVTRNECIRKYRERLREIPADIEEMLADPTVVHQTHDDPEESILAHQRQVALRQALSGAPTKGRAILETLLEQPALTTKELANRLGMPVGSIGPTRQRCVRKLRATPSLARLK